MALAAMLLSMAVAPEAHALKCDWSAVGAKATAGYTAPCLFDATNTGPDKKPIADSPQGQQVREIEREAARRVLGQGAKPAVDIPGSGTGTGTVRTAEQAVQSISGYDGNGASVPGRGVATLNGQTAAETRVARSWARVGLRTGAFGKLLVGAGTVGAIVTTGEMGWTIGTRLRTMFLGVEGGIPQPPWPAGGLRVVYHAAGTTTRDACGRAGTGCASMVLTEDMWNLQAAPQDPATCGCTPSWWSVGGYYSGLPGDPCDNRPAGWDPYVGAGGMPPWSGFASGGVTCQVGAGEYAGQKVSATIFDVGATESEIVAYAKTLRPKRGSDLPKFQAQKVPTCTAGCTINNPQVATDNELDTGIARELNRVDSPLATQIAHAIDPVQTPEDPTTLTVPMPFEHETYAAYLTRLQALSLVGKVTVLPSSAPDPCCGPNEVTATDPAPGTALATGTSVNVQANPSNAPAPGTSPGTGGGTGTAPDYNVDPDPPADPGPPVVPAPDLGPLAGLLPCDVFPFGVPCWVVNGIGDWATTSQAPTFDLPIVDLTSGDVEQIHVDLGVIDPLIAIVRPILVIGATFAIAWWFFNLATTGAGPSGGAAREED